MPRHYLLACAALVGCSGGSSSSSPSADGGTQDAAGAVTLIDNGVDAAAASQPITFAGTETITYEVGTPMYALIPCPASGVLVLDSKIVLSLRTHTAWETVVSTKCVATETVPSTEVKAGPPTTTSATLLDWEYTDVENALENMTPRPSTTCKTSGDVVFLTIDRGDGNPTIYGDDQGTGCPPIFAILPAQELADAFTPITTAFN